MVITRKFRAAKDREEMPTHAIARLGGVALELHLRVLRFYFLQGLKKSLGAICRQLKDPRRNGGKSLAELQRHNAEDSLVGWGWNPGPGRQPAPGSQKIFGELTQAWIDAGATCPKP